MVVSHISRQLEHSLIVEPLRNEDADAYDEFVCRHPDGLFYYRWPYAQLLTELLGCRREYRVAKQDGRIVGVLPLMAVEALGGLVYNSLPFYGSHGGVLASNSQARTALVQAYNALACDGRTVASTVVANPFADEEPGPFTHEYVDERIAQYMEWPAGAAFDSIASRIDSSARRNAHKAQQAGITVAIEPDALLELYRLHTAGMLAIGGRAKLKRFFEIVPNYFQAGRDYEVYLARLDGRAVGGLLVFYSNKTAEYFVPASDPFLRSLQPLAVILHAAIQDAWRRGLTRWNWGGTWVTQSGVYQFKKKWGAQEKLYRYYTHLNDTSILQRSSQELMAACPNFFIVPFNHLLGEHAHG